VETLQENWDNYNYSWTWHRNLWCILW